jgi:hypothetical protein
MSPRHFIDSFICAHAQFTLRKKGFEPHPGWFDRFRALSVSGVLKRSRRSMTVT